LPRRKDSCCASCAPPSAKLQFPADVPGRRLGDPHTLGANSRNRYIIPSRSPRDRERTMRMKSLLLIVLTLAPAAPSPQPAPAAQTLLTGKAAMGDWRADAPGR